MGKEEGKEQTEDIKRNEEIIKQKNGENKQKRPN
jgi:hypothetical protein